MSDIDRYVHAVALVHTWGKPSPSFLQRKMQIGHAEAVSYIDRMEAAGLVTRPNSAGLRSMTALTAAKGHIPFRDHRNQYQVRKDEEAGRGLARLSGECRSHAPFGMERKS